MEKIRARAEFSDYLILPTKYKFLKTVRLYGYVIKFVTKARKGRKFLGMLLGEAKLWFSIFTSMVDNSTKNRSNQIRVLTAKQSEMLACSEIITHFSLKTFSCASTENELILTDQVLHQALLYLYRKGSLEVKKFLNKKVVTKIAHEIDGILLS